jgi:transcription initiation factor TFIIIB Brf1 subunit/transcription initiation factor TFIIB
VTIKTSQQDSWLFLVKDLNTGELMRKDTGEIVSDDDNDVISQEKEWRTFDLQEDSRARAGAPTSLAFHDMGLSTMIGKEDTDASGNHIEKATQMKMRRLKIPHREVTAVRQKRGLFNERLPYCPRSMIDCLCLIT